MKINHYHPNEDGDLRFFVASQLFPLILAHLKRKGLNVGGTHNPTAEENEIWLEGTIHQANEALADFDKMNEIRKQSKATQAELARIYPSRKMVRLACATLGCKNHVDVVESEWQTGVKYYCGACLSKALET